MNEILEQSFCLMCDKYNQLLKEFYPAHGSTGFTESNQVHIYVNSLIKSLNDDMAIEWLELPWKNKKQHIDAMVYSHKYKSIFYIEAKRFLYKSKVTSLFKDIDRVINVDRTFINDYNIKEIKNEYIIVLFDIWLETKWKKSVPSWWVNDSLTEANSFRNQLKRDFNIDWMEARQFCKKIDSIEKYRLLMSYKKIESIKSNL